MHLNTFLQAFNRLGLTQWDGIEDDVAWGHVTSLMGLARPCMDGPIFIYRAQCRIGEQSPTRFSAYGYNPDWDRNLFWQLLPPFYRLG